MKIEFRQSGGFAGLVKSIAIDIDKIPVGEAKVLQSLVNRSKFFNLPEPVQRGMPDEEQIFITVEMTGRSRTIFMSTSAVTDDLKPLIQYLVSRAKYEKRKK
jgi:hypothetical protein